MSDKSIIEKIPNDIPTYVYRVSDVLSSNGFEAYLVGGSVRDLLLGKTPKDFDIATNARPNEVQNLFPKCISTGAKFGTVLVVIEDEFGERFDVEVTTYRSESDYYGGRWPGKVEFTNTIEQDLSRRDFTINAIAIDLTKLNRDDILLEEKIIDPYKGQIDLNSKLVRAVGNPIERFTEDGLRPIRACRFASVLDFEIEKDTFDAIGKTLNIVKMVAVERVRDEFNKILLNSHVPSKGIDLLQKTGILSIYIPELVEAKNFYQPQYHSDNVYDHSLKAMDLAEDQIKWAALLHDIGKVKTKTEDENGIHYYGHDIEGAKMSVEILKRLRFSNKEIDRISNLIRWHMFHYPSGEWRKSNEIEEIKNNINSTTQRIEHGWSDAAVRRFIKNVGGEDAVDELIKLRIADATSNSKSSFSNDEIEVFQERIARVRSEDMALKISDLDISGKDLAEMGYEQGPQYRNILNFLLEEVLEDPTNNQRIILKNLVSKKFPKQ